MKYLAIILLILLPFHLFPANGFVHLPSGKGGQTGADWANAWDNLNDANNQMSAGDTLFTTGLYQNGTTATYWTMTGFSGTFSRLKSYL